MGGIQPGAAGVEDEVAGPDTAVNGYSGRTAHFSTGPDTYGGAAQSVTLLPMAEERAPEPEESARETTKPAHEWFHHHRRATIGWFVALPGALALALLTGVTDKVVDQFWNTDSHPPPTETEVRFVRPFDLSGKLAAPFEPDPSMTFQGGKCIEGYESSDPDALRCFADHYVMDPCWAGPSDVACPADPWDKNVALLLDPEVEPGPPSISRTDWDTKDTAWALELIDPFHPEQTLKCTFAGGATDFIANNRVNWWCANDSSKGFAAGDLKKNSDGPWTVLYMAQGTSEGRDALVKTIWR